MAQQQKIELQDLDLQQLVEVKKQLEEVRIPSTLPKENRNAGNQGMELFKEQWRRI